MTPWNPVVGEKGDFYREVVASARGAPKSGGRCRRRFKRALAIRQSHATRQKMMQIEDGNERIAATFATTEFGKIDSAKQ
jgi:hypothetical protein